MLASITADATVANAASQGNLRLDGAEPRELVSVDKRDPWREARLCDNCMISPSGSGWCKKQTRVSDPGGHSSVVGVQACVIAEREAAGDGA
ncbi:hypothetical protein ACFRFH_09620 [Leifsonia sp. NPDC056824]|uniref:hypothetical protein n=1 Tax=Leifsonia sp. NPDC056824 TaxID=3345953 RepID=UPI0036C732F3